MAEIVNLDDIIVNYFKQKRTLQEAAADLGAIILEIKREEQYYGKHTSRMAELKKLAELQEKVLSKMMDRSDDSTRLPRVKYLKLQK